MLAAAGPSYTEQNVAQALRDTFPHNLAPTKKFGHVVDESEDLIEETDATLEQGVGDEELDNVLSEFHRASQEAKHGD